MTDVEIITNISGLDELEDALNAGGKKAAQRFLRSIERKAAKVVLNAMEETVPVVTGALRDSLAIRSTTGQDGLTVMVGPTKDENYIGRFTEFGTVKQPAQHWMDEAFQSSKEESLTVLIEEATKSLEEMKE